MYRNVGDSVFLYYVKCIHLHVGVVHMYIHTIIVDCMGVSKPYTLIICVPVIIIITLMACMKH